jgi:carbon-monoxide dehydrogenase medium subunit
MEFKSPTTVDEAVSLLKDAGDGARVLAGGTDLLVQMRSGRTTPSLVIDLKKIPELMQITEDASGFRIGAAVPSAEIDEHAGLKKAWPGFVEALELIGSTQIQGRCTAGGNLCNASPAADSVPAMIAASAVCEVAGPGGRRKVKVEDIPVGPGRTSLGAGEFVVAIELPPKPTRTGDAYLRFIPRTEMDIAVVGTGISLTLDDSGKCVAARVGLGAVAPTALLVEDAASALVGTELDDAALENMASAVRAACNPIDDKRGTIEYRTKVAGELAMRTARIALERARAS